MDFLRVFDLPLDSHIDLPYESQLPSIGTGFLVEPLEDKPQNPILDALKLEALNSNLPPRPKPSPKQVPIPKELSLLALDSSPPKPAADRVTALWRDALIRRQGVKNGLLSWDRLRQSHPSHASPTSFLSEQDDRVFTAALLHVQPRPYDTVLNIPVSDKELLEGLNTTVLGISSSLFTWNTDEESFKACSPDPGKDVVFSLEGKDETITNSSIITRFLTIGTLLRRLELLVTELRRRSATDGPTIHAFAHALSTTLSYIRDSLMRTPPSAEDLALESDRYPLFFLWTHYLPYEELLSSLATFCKRNIELVPTSYEALESQPIPLLSRIYEHLELNFEQHSSSLIRSVFAFILTCTSQEYIQDIARSVGFGKPAPKRAPKREQSTYELQLEDDEDEEEEDILELLDNVETNFPSFFPKKTIEALPAAQKSLVLLRIAQPEHRLLSTAHSHPTIRWIWTTDEINAAWSGKPVPSDSNGPQNSNLHLLSEEATSAGLAAFKLFDLEPGSLTTQSTFKMEAISPATLDAFIKRFPDALPAITPTMPDLTTLTFRSLTIHATEMSSTLLDVFLRSSDHLNFRSHLILLRSYLLLAGPKFKARILTALFSDAGQHELENNAHSMTIRSLRRRPGKQYGQGNQPWAVGLSPNLLDREMWPPVGADLSFFLRTVIVDSLDYRKEKDDVSDGEEGGTTPKLNSRGNPREHEDDDVSSQVIEEAGWRLGFAIRDLPTGSGRDKWMDPLSIEALDFLYMDYKPPHPMEILISPDILDKYQRMFTFILRLQRVECAIKSLFRMSSHKAIATYLFPTLTKSRRLLLHFRFIAHTFVESLSGYVFDTVIRGNFDPFLARLEQPPDVSSQDASFTDVFHLSRCHSAVLNDMLNACLLRTGQKNVGDLLRQCLEIVLELTIVIGELHRDRLKEYQAATFIEDLFSKFRGRMATLVRVLKGLVEKNSSSLKFVSDATPGATRRPTGGLDALYHLLVRLTLNDWWTEGQKAV
ncbi:hypothetical protein CVT24_001621 [Panaeolus cyanescens]|uniref:Spindle pole body component n=1 Tax=Panaeolus cyanescens TaxID=181874 RepID=A0A409YF87_9AGAR|nr:hypothetical protein CVT24_001621 [Panaeolus cyanescens]